MIWVGLSGEHLNVAALTERARTNAAGGVVVFEGTTRSGSEYGEVTALEYEAYEDRALKQLREIATSAVEKWKLESAVIEHRTGTVPVGEPGVVVVAAAQHRVEAFEACECMIDSLKSTAAIWKREIYADGSSRWR